MLQISGNENAVKSEMYHRSAEIKQELKELKKRIRALKKESPSSTEYIVSLEMKAKKLEDRLQFYQPSKVLPVQLEGVVINFKAYQKYSKALKKQRIDFQTKLEGSSVVIKHRSGALELKDLSEHFKGFVLLPKAEIVGG